MPLDINNPIHCINVCEFLHQLEEQKAKLLSDDEREAITLTCIVLAKVYTNNLVNN